MDIKRSVLLVALAAVAYMMLLQWKKDYDNPEQPTYTQATTNNSVATNPAVNVDNRNPLTNPVPAGEANTPVNTIPTGSNQLEKNSQLIQVQTDVLNVLIDPNGGDIVELSLTEYPEALNTPNKPFKLFSNSGDVYYKATSRFIEHNAAASQPQYTSDKNFYQLEEGQDELKVNLTYTNNNVNYLKTFTFKRGIDANCAKKTKRVGCVDAAAYSVDVGFEVNNNSDKAWQGFMFTQLLRNGAADPSSAKATSMSTFLGIAYWTQDKPYTKVALKNIDGIMTSAIQKNTPVPTVTVTGGWIAWLQHYFVTAWVPNKDEQHAVSTYKDAQGNYIVGFTGPLVTAQAGEQIKDNITLYAGPKLRHVLKELSPGLDLTIDYGILSVIAKPILWLLRIIQTVIGNWGWSIIVLTIIIKLLFFPLSATSYRSMARMRAASPKMQAIKARFGDDKQKMSQAMMELYKKEKLNPLSGCLPILIQMPVFIALYWVLQGSVEIRQAPWLGWIQDLSASDPYFILPIIMGATMFLQQQLNPAPIDPIQAKMFKIMPIAFTFFFIWFPSGLVLYWIVNNILSIAQQWVITRQIESAAKTKADLAK